jgi:hypothetical protein
MFKKLKQSSPPLVVIGVICVFLVVLFIAAQVGAISQPATTSGIRDACGAAEFVAEFGWEVVIEPSSVRTVIIPAEFDSLYEEYNNLQKSQGFDLTRYRSKTATMYTFRVLNHPASESPAGIFANVLVCNGKVIAGDLVSYALDGFIAPLSGEVSSVCDSERCTGVQGSVCDVAC